MDHFGLLRAAIDSAGFGLFNLRMFTALRGGHVSPVGSRDPATSADVSIVIPARNEANNLPALLRSIGALEPAPREVIVVDDDSTDETARIAAAFGARVVVPGPLPRGWIGKPWACAAGAAAATSSVLLFTDADTVHAPGLLGRALGALARADLVSVIPSHLVVSVWERFQGIFQLLLLVATRAGAARAAHGERCFCIGQFLLIRRAAYDRIGGHAAVRDRVAEDLAFARLIEEHGLSFSLVHAPFALRVRMYPEGLRSFIRGWRRNFREGLRAAGVVGVVETALVIAWLLDVPRQLIETSLHADLAPVAVSLGAAFVSWLMIARWQRELGPFRARDALTYPIFTLLFAWISGLAWLDQLRRRPVAWKGRSVQVDELRHHQSRETKT